MVVMMVVRVMATVMVVLMVVVVVVMVMCHLIQLILKTAVHSPASKDHLYSVLISSSYYDS